MLRVGMPSRTLCVLCAPKVSRLQRKTRSVDTGVPTRSMGTSLADTISASGVGAVEERGIEKGSAELGGERCNGVVDGRRQAVPELRLEHPMLAAGQQQTFIGTQGDHLDDGSQVGLEQAVEILELDR
jgi:hypothetical protein